MYYDLFPISRDIKAEIGELFLHLEPQTKEDIKITIEELFVDLKKNNILKINPELQKTSRIMHRMRDSLVLIMKYQKMTKNEDESRHYAEINKKWFDVAETELIISNLHIQHLLENIEYGRTLLKDVLDIEKTNAVMDKLYQKIHNKNFKKHIGDMTSLSYIVQFFSVLFEKQKYKKILYNPLRNPFAHNNYFWRDDKLIYLDKKNNEQEVSLRDMRKLIAETIFVIDCIHNEIKLTSIDIRNNNEMF